MNKKAKLFLFSLIIFQTGLLYGQTPAREAMNSFVLFTKKQSMADLEKAKTAIDNGFQTKKDSLSYRNNLVRSLVYSTLAYADSNRRLSYKIDPIEETLFSFGNLKNPKLNYEHEPEMNFIRKQLANAFLIRANRALKGYDYEQAYDAYRWVDSLNSGTVPSIKHNLAVLSQKLGYTSRAIGYYEQLIVDKQNSSPIYYLTLASFYEAEGDSNKALEIIQDGRLVFPRNEDLLFKELNIYADNGAYSAVVGRVKDALQLQPDNLNLNYLAAFSFDQTGKDGQAEELYKKVISLNPNNYDANYSLGLFYLKRYLNESDLNKDDLLLKAKTFLTKAFEIDPNAVNVLKSLSILYEKTGDMIKLEKVNNKLNQIILN